MSNSLDPDQTGQNVRPDLGLNCLQRLSAEDTSRQRVKYNCMTSFITLRLQNKWKSIMDHDQLAHLDLC